MATRSPRAEGTTAPVARNVMPAMFSSGGAVTSRLTRRVTLTNRRRLDATPPSAAGTLTRRLADRRRCRRAEKRPPGELRTPRTAVHAPPSSRSTTTVTAAAGATRPVSSAPVPEATATGARKLATTVPGGAAAAAAEGSARAPSAPARTA
jgi:hypothetical protein